MMTREKAHLPGKKKDSKKLYFFLTNEKRSDILLVKILALYQSEC